MSASNARITANTGLLTYIDDNQVSVAGVAAGLDAGGIPDGTQVALVQAYDGEVRWRMGGNTPTAAVGMVIHQGETIQVNILDLDDFEMIAVTGTVEVNVAFMSFATAEEISG